MRRFVRENGLFLVPFAMFLCFLVGQSLAGERRYNEEQRDHGEPTVGFGDYLKTADFGEATFENW